MSSDLSQFFGQDFDIASVPSATDFIPPGKIPCLIEAAEVRQTKKGDGHYIGLVLSPLLDPHKNRKLFVNINIDNPSDQCVAIGLATLASLCKALSIMSPQNTDQFLNQVVIAHVRVKDEQNVVNTFSAASGPTAATASTAPAATPAELAAPQFTPPQQAPPENTLQQAPVSAPPVTGSAYPWQKPSAPAEGEIPF